MKPEELQAVGTGRYSMPTGLWSCVDRRRCRRQGLEFTANGGYQPGFEPLFFGVKDGQMELRHGAERERFGFDESGRARSWLADRQYPIALGSSSVDHPEDYGATLDEVDCWLVAVFERRRSTCDL